MFIYDDLIGDDEGDEDDVDVPIDDNIEVENSGWNAAAAA